jgi:transcriptional regulator with XRE-family HTH domain
MSTPSGRARGVEIDTLRFAQARREAQLSLSEVGGREMSRSLVHQVQNGSVRPSPEKLEIMARRLGHDPSWFVLPPTDPPPLLHLTLTFLAGAEGGSLKLTARGQSGQSRALASLHLSVAEWKALCTLRSTTGVELFFEEA